MRLSVRVMQGGERVPFLLDESGLPLFYPTLFETAQLRNGGAAVNTIRNKLGDIEVLLQWEHAHGRDLVAEFAAGDMLTLSDIVSLRDFCGFDMRYAKESTSRVSAAGSVRWLEAQIASVEPQPTISK
ncbi:MAG TPA: hypothetical protein VN629_02010, partial [Castellaniella sp.]|nr:hypothetical protein [Castellaniella sp.]